MNVEGEGFSSEAASALRTYLEDEFGKGTVKLGGSGVGASALLGKLGGAAGGAKNAAGSLAQNENVQNVVNEAKDAFKKAFGGFGGLFGRKK